MSVFVFNLALNRMPVSVRLPVVTDGKLTEETKVYPFKRFDRRDVNAWQVKLDSEREERACAKLNTPEERARMLLAYPILPLTREGLSQYVFTSPGAMHVFRTCAEKSEVPKEVIDAVDRGEYIDDAMLGNLAIALFGIAPVEEIAKRITGDLPAGKDGEKKQEHPLPIKSAD